MRRKGARHQSVVADVTANQFHFSAEPGQVGLFDEGVVVVVEIIDNHDGVARRHQGFAQVGTDEAGSACDQKFF